MFGVLTGLCLYIWCLGPTHPGIGEMNPHTALPSLTFGEALSSTWEWGNPTDKAPQTNSDSWPRSAPALELLSRAASSVGVTSPFQWSQRRKQLWRRADQKERVIFVTKIIFRISCEKWQLTLDRMGSKKRSYLWYGNSRGKWVGLFACLVLLFILVEKGLVSNHNFYLVVLCYSETLFILLPSVSQTSVTHLPVKLPHISSLNQL